MPMSWPPRCLNTASSSRGGSDARTSRSAVSAHWRRSATRSAWGRRVVLIPARTLSRVCCPWMRPPPGPPRMAHRPCGSAARPGQRGRAGHVAPIGRWCGGSRSLLATTSSPTHPAIVPRPLNPREATANVESLLDRPHVRTAGDARDRVSVRPVEGGAGRRHAGRRSRRRPRGSPRSQLRRVGMGWRNDEPICRVAHLRSRMSSSTIAQVVSGLDRLPAFGPLPALG